VKVASIVKVDIQYFQYFRSIPTPDGQEIIVQVDFLAGEYEGRGRRHRHQRVAGMQPRKARGCDLAFATPTEIRIEGVLPGGGRDSATVRVTGVAAFIIMKGMALEDRLKEKDACYLLLTVNLKRNKRSSISKISANPPAAARSSSR
jgi:hypothetical protein